MDTQTILDIRAHRDSIKNSLQKLRKVGDSGGKYGSEQEYTIRDIVAEINSILTGISALTRAPKQFIQKSTHFERKQLLESLGNLYESIESVDPDRSVSAIDEIKPVFRNLGVCYTDEWLESFDEHVNEVQQASSSLSQHIATIENQIAGVEHDVDTSRRHMEVVDDFRKKIVDRELQLENQEAATVQYQKKLEAFETEHKRHISEAKELIKSAKHALGYTTAEGLSAAFAEQYKKADNVWLKVGWVLAAGGFVTAAVLLGIQITTEEQTTRLEVVVSRIFVLSVLISAAVFSARQYVRQKNIAEDYAYKAVLAKSIVGFSDQLTTENDEEDGNHSYYMRKVLDQIHQDPLRKHAQKDSLVKKVTNIVGRTDETES